MKLLRSTGVLGERSCAASTIRQGSADTLGLLLRDGFVCAQHTVTKRAAPVPVALRMRVFVVYALWIWEFCIWKRVFTSWPGDTKGALWDARAVRRDATAQRTHVLCHNYVIIIVHLCAWFMK